MSDSPACDDRTLWERVTGWKVGNSKTDALIVALVVGGLVVLGKCNNSRFDSSTRARVGSATHELSILAEAIQQYRLDNGSLPSPRPLDDWTTSSRVKSSEWNRIVRPGMTYALSSLTTPVAYVEPMLSDRTMRIGRIPYLFIPRSSHFLLLGVGPDMDYDVLPPYDWPDGGVAAVQGYLVDLKYDPTNGLRSSGDVVLVDAPRLQGPTRPDAVAPPP